MRVSAVVTLGLGPAAVFAGSKAQDSVAVAHAYGIFLDQGLNPSPLHSGRQILSPTADHQESPRQLFSLKGSSQDGMSQVLSVVSSQS